MSNDIPEYSTMSRNRDAAIKALAAMPVKPIRVMLPSDYSGYREATKPVAIERVKANFGRRLNVHARKALALKCAVYLREHGPTPTSQLSKHFQLGCKFIGFACGIIPGIAQERKRCGVIWSLGKLDSAAHQ